MPRLAFAALALSILACGPTIGAVREFLEDPSSPELLIEPDTEPVPDSPDLPEPAEIPAVVQGQMAVIEQDIEGGLEMWRRLVTVAPQSAEALSVRDELEALTSAHPGS